MLIDIHSHIDLYHAEQEEIKKIIRNATENNVKIILNCGVNIASNRKTLELAEKFSEVKACLGIYPIEALNLSEKEIEKEIEFIEKNKDKIAAIGEVGLDLFHASQETLEIQKRIFRKFLELAKKLNKPLIVHSRKAEAETIEVIEEFSYSKIIMHCFSGRMQLVERIIKNNWFLSIPCIIKSSSHFQKIAEITPLNQLFAETDSPYLHPDKKPKNEPSNVVVAYEKIAEIKKIPVLRVEKAIEKSYRNLFE